MPEREPGMDGAVWKWVHPRNVIWVFLAVIVSLLMAFGGDYKGRIERLEDDKLEQNDHLRDIINEIKHPKT